MVDNTALLISCLLLAYVAFKAMQIDIAGDKAPEADDAATSAEIRQQTWRRRP